MFIFDELDTCSRDLSNDYALGHCLLGVMKLTKNVNPDKYREVMVLNLIHVHNFHCQLVNGLKILG